MQRFVVSPHNRKSLERLRSEAGWADVLRNALIVLLSAEGRSKAELSRDLGCSTATIDRARRRYRQRGVDGLLPVKPPGRPSRATPAFRAAMAEAVGASPMALGYGFSTWSVSRLAAHLKKTTKVGFSDDQLRRLLLREGFSVQRPKHTMKGKRDEAEFERAKGELESLKKGLSSPAPPRP
jgi:transposase